MTQFLYSENLHCLIFGFFNNNINSSFVSLEILFTEEYFSIKNLPEKQTENFTLTAINLAGKKPVLCFTINKNYDIFLIRTEKNKEEILDFSPEKYENFVNFTDKTAKNNKIYTYKLKFCDKFKNEEFYSNEIKLRIYDS